MLRSPSSPVIYWPAMPSLLDISTSGSSELPIYTITFTNPPDHRLTHALMAEVGEALNRIERDWRAKRAGGRKVGGAVILRGQGEKFFSNGRLWSLPRAGVSEG